MSPGGIYIFLHTFPRIGRFKHTAVHLTNKQLLHSSWSSSLQPTVKALEWQCKNRLKWHFFQRLSFPGNAAKQLRWPFAENLWMEVILWLNISRPWGSLNCLLQNRVLFLGSLYCWRNKPPNPRTENTNTMFLGDQRHISSSKLQISQQMQVWIICWESFV